MNFSNTSRVPAVARRELARLLTNSAQPDVDAFTDADRAAFTEDLFAWVEPGPPRSGRRIVAGAELFEHRLPSGIVLTYVVNDEVPYVAVVRARKR